MTKLSVNINKIATLRNARGEDNPNILHMAKLIEAYGAQGITVHPRPDERHIKKRDVLDLKKNLKVEFNVEGYPSADFIHFMHEIRPEQITLVPDPPDVLTSNAGFRLTDDFAFVCEAIAQLAPTKSRISIFIDPKDFMSGDLAIIKATGTDRIEMYTKDYADNFGNEIILGHFESLALRAKKIGLGVNAGHDLSLQNLQHLVSHIPVIDEVSIGHALICDALTLGMKESVQRYLAALMPA